MQTNLAAFLCTCSSHDISVSAKVRLLRLQKCASGGRSDERKVGTLFNRRVAELQRPTFYNQFPVCFGNDPTALVRQPPTRDSDNSESPDNPIQIAGPRVLSRPCTKIGMLAMLSKDENESFCLVAKYCKENDDEHITVTKLTKYIWETGSMQKPYRQYQFRRQGKRFDVKIHFFLNIISVV